MFTFEKFDTTHLIVFALMATLGTLQFLSAALLLLVIYLLETGRFRTFNLFKFPEVQQIKMYVSIFGLGVGAVLSMMFVAYTA